MSCQYSTQNKQSEKNILENIYEEKFKLKSGFRASEWFSSFLKIYCYLQEKNADIVPYFKEPIEFLDVVVSFRTHA